MTHVESLKSTNEALLSRVSALESRIEELQSGPTDTPSMAPVDATSPKPTQQYYEAPSLKNLKCAWGERVFTKYNENFAHCIRSCRSRENCQYVGIIGTQCFGCPVVPYIFQQGVVNYAMSPMN